MRLAIVLCTYNRLHQLRETLTAIKQAHIPEGIQSEILVVDNASTDGSGEWLQMATASHPRLRVVYEPKRGKGCAYNRALIETQAEWLLFADDDVRPKLGWVDGMLSPLCDGKADALAGGVEIAPHLLRNWMTKWHRVALASTEDLHPEEPDQMIGANMAFSRRVLKKVPAFDAELGPGALGFGEETVFSLQIRQAGFRLKGALDVMVEHHPDPSRLQRKAWLEYAERAGRVKAYTDYHWLHSEPRFLAVRRLLAFAKLKRRKLKHRRDNSVEEGCPHWEISLLSELSYYRHLRVESRRVRNYDCRGLKKVRGII